MADHTLLSLLGVWLAGGSRALRWLVMLLPLVVVQPVEATEAPERPQAIARAQSVERSESLESDVVAEPLAIDVVATERVPESLDALRDVLLDLAEFGSWFPALGEWRILSGNSNSALVYGRQSLPWPLRDRDYVVLYRWWTLDDGSFFLEAVAQRDAAPQSPRGVIRIERMTTRWRLRPVEKGTETRYAYAGEVGGSLPDWVARIGWESRTGVVVRALVQEVARRSRADRR